MTNKENSDQVAPINPVLIFFGIPVLILVTRYGGFWDATSFNQTFSLANASSEVRDKLSYILFVPIGATLVVFVRLSLGLRLLGPYRSLLLAVAFQVAGFFFGMAVLILSIVTLYLATPSIRSLDMPYFGRSLLTLSTVALMVVVLVIVGMLIHMEGIEAVAYFPLVVLCLIAEAYLKTAKKEGNLTAMGRGVTTIIVALILAGIASVSLFNEFLIYHPELLLVQMGIMVFVGQNMQWRLFQDVSIKDQTLKIFSVEINLEKMRVWRRKPVEIFSKHGQSEPSIKDNIAC